MAEALEFSRIVAGGGKADAGGVDQDIEPLAGRSQISANGRDRLVVARSHGRRTCAGAVPLRLRPNTVAPLAASRCDGGADAARSAGDDGRAVQRKVPRV